MAYPARPRQSARIVTTNVEESAEAEVADRVTVKAKGRIVHCLTRQSVYLENCSSQMSEEELSFQDDRAYPDNREEVTMSNIRSPKGTRQARNRRMPNGTYGGVGGRKTKVGQKTYYVFRPTRFWLPRFLCIMYSSFATSES